jgi:ribosomal protein L7/L12
MGLFSPNTAALEARLARLERKLDLLLANLGIEAPADGMDHIRDLAASGNKIGAIKAYREATGVGLAKAKAAVERGV